MLKLNQLIVYVAAFFATRYFLIAAYRAITGANLESPAVGLETLAEGINPTVDIVFIHGLDGHWSDTWTTHNRKFWLKDFLPHDIPHARIFSYGYDSRTIAAGQLSQQTLDAIGEELIQELAAVRKDTKTEPQRPIIFVTHSLGGLVLKSGLIHAHISGNGHLNSHKEVRLSTYGIIFISCPHRGGEGAGVMTAIARFAYLFIHTNWNLLKHLRVGSEWLQSTERQFMSISNDIKISFFYELYAMDFGLFGFIPVPVHSATIPGRMDANVISIPGDHRSVVKFSSERDIGYKKIVRELNNLVEGIYQWKTSKGWLQSELLSSV